MLQFVVGSLGLLHGIQAVVTEKGVSIVEMFLARNVGLNIR